MAGDLIIEEGDLEVLRDRTNGSAYALARVWVAWGGGFFISALGGVEVAPGGHAAA